MLRGWYGQAALAVGWATPASRLSLLGPQVKQAATHHCSNGPVLAHYCSRIFEFRYFLNIPEIQLTSKILLNW
jgi:hypothetical protein